MTSVNLMKWDGRPLACLSDQDLGEILLGLRRLAELQRQSAHYAYCIMQEEAPEILRANLGKWKAEIGDWRSFVSEPLFTYVEGEATRRKLLLDTSIKLDKEVDLSSRGILERQVVGALRDAVNCHGPITRENANSAAKRVIGAIKTYKRKVRG